MTMDIQFISHQNEHYSYIDGIKMALEGGCRWIQLRMKDASDQEIIDVANIVRPWCRQYRAKFILDDYVLLVKVVGADGVHLGKNDMPLDEARQWLGSDFIIGGTANTFEDAERLHCLGADYIGCGPYRFTTTKKNLSPILGPDGYRCIVRHMNDAGWHIPIVAIGGIVSEDIPEVMSTGVDGIAVSGVVLNDPHPSEKIKSLILEVLKYKR
jgi:thiamine-phosphate pyrophosphorylase